MSRPALARFIGKETGVDAAKNDERATLPSESADDVASEGVASMNANAHDVAWFNSRGVEALERFVHD
jgi:hypothetical protein